MLDQNALRDHSERTACSRLRPREDKPSLVFGLTANLHAARGLTAPTSEKRTGAARCELHERQRACPNWARNVIPSATIAGSIAPGGRMLSLSEKAHGRAGKRVRL